MGWWVSEYEDIVNANGEYHSFLCVRKVYPKTFKSVITNHCAPIREGASYRIVNVSYMAWIFQEPPPKSLILIVIDDSNILRSTALYDLSEVYAGKPIYSRLNETRSIVFHEFEKFLETEYGLNFTERLPPPPPEHTVPKKVSLNA
ncbi:MAG: hypothetical protein N3E47_06375 [Candidatus Bathyarchaeota archaeon]|nr:hypothetical protein [Candidatus Bathyarchaeota archaeon]